MVNSFNQFIDDREYKFYCEAIDFYQENYNKGLNESFLSSVLPASIKKYYDFIKDLVDKTKVNIKSIVNFFRDRGVFDFFKRIKFSLKELFNIVKKGFSYYKDLQNAISEYVASTKVVQWTSDKIRDLDKFLSKHPKTRRLVGFAVGAILIYIWLNMSFTGDFDYDFDQSTLIGALLGRISLSDVFAGPEGVKLLTLFITGSFLSFPWPGPQTALFVASLVYGLAKSFNVKDILQQLRR